MDGLTDKQQAMLMLLVFILVPFGTWTGLGFPTDKAALGLLASNLIAGLVLAVKEMLGGKAPA